MNAIEFTSEIQSPAQNAADLLDRLLTVASLSFEFNCPAWEFAHHGNVSEAIVLDDDNEEFIVGRATYADEAIAFDPIMTLTPAEVVRFVANRIAR